MCGDNSARVHVDVYAGVAQVCGAGVGEARVHWSRHYRLLGVHACAIVPSGSVKVKVSLGEGDCRGLETIMGTWIISSCSDIVASITCSRVVCCDPITHVKLVQG